MLRVSPLPTRRPRPATRPEAPMSPIDSGHDLAPGWSPPQSASGRWLPIWLCSLLWFLGAASLIGISDHLLRRQENLTASLANPPVIILFSDYLQDQVHVKMQWIGLLATRDKA